MSRKRDHLIQTGEKLFVKHGMRRITVEEICRQAGVSKPTFYRYFENKEALARFIFESWIDEGLEQIDGIEEAETPFPEKLRTILTLKRVFVARPGPEFLEDLLQLEFDLGRVLARVMRFLTHGQRNGAIRSDIRPELMLAAFDLLNSIHHDTRIQDLYADPEALVEDIFRLFLYGALSPTQREAGLPEASIHGRGEGSSP